MQLKVSKQKAIRRINTKIDELRGLDVDLGIWKSNTLNELELIFEPGALNFSALKALKSSKASGTGFWSDGSAYEQDTNRELRAKFRENATKLLESYAKQVEEYGVEPRENIDGVLADKFAALNIKYVELQGSYSDLVDKYNGRGADINALNIEADHLKRETAPLEKVDIPWMFKHRLYESLIALAAVLGTGVAVGMWGMDVRNDNQQLELKQDKIKLQNTVDSLRSIILKPVVKIEKPRAVNPGFSKQ